MKQAQSYRKFDATKTNNIQNFKRMELNLRGSAFIMRFENSHKTF